MRFIALIASLFATACGGRVALGDGASPASDSWRDATATGLDAGLEDAVVHSDAGCPSSDSNLLTKDSGLSCENMVSCPEFAPGPCGCGGFGLMVTVECSAFDTLVAPLLPDEPASWRCPGNDPGVPPACAGAAADWFCHTELPTPVPNVTPELFQILCDLAGKGLAFLSCQITG